MGSRRMGVSGIGVQSLRLEKGGINYEDNRRP